MKQSPSNMQLETLLIGRGLTVVKSESDWQIRRGVGLTITYYPATGSVRIGNSAMRFKAQALRGSPLTIAEVLDELATAAGAKKP